VISAERARDQAAIELSLLWRDDEGRPVLVSEDRLPRLETPPDRPPIAFDALLSEALDRRPDLARVRAQRAQAEAELTFATNQILPGLDAAVAVSKDMGDAPDGDLKRGKTVLEGSLVLDVPLQTRLLTGRETAADAALARVRAQERLTQDRVRADLLDATNAVAAAVRRLDSARRELSAAREVEQGERLRYELGESNLIFVNLREQQSAETALREVDALVEFHKARAALDVARGTVPVSR
jgi:outer membrane protein TolC